MSIAFEIKKMNEQKSLGMEGIYQAKFLFLSQYSNLFSAGGNMRKLNGSFYSTGRSRGKASHVVLVEIFISATCAFLPSGGFLFTADCQLRVCTSFQHLTPVNY
jgi:hypothetical protein